MRSRSLRSEILSGLLCKSLIGRSGHGRLVMFDVTHPVEREHTMTKREVKTDLGIAAAFTAVR
jgi:hypothetical protein